MTQYRRFDANQKRMRAQRSDAFDSTKNTTSGEVPCEKANINNLYSAENLSCFRTEKVSKRREKLCLRNAQMKRTVQLFGCDAPQNLVSCKPWQLKAKSLAAQPCGKFQGFEAHRDGRVVDVLVVLASLEVGQRGAAAGGVGHHLGHSTHTWVPVSARLARTCASGSDRNERDRHMQLNSTCLCFSSTAHASVPAT